MKDFFGRFLLGFLIGGLCYKLGYTLASPEYWIAAIIGTAGMIMLGST